jgi:hypothetical protein
MFHNRLTGAESGSVATMTEPATMNGFMMVPACLFPACASPLSAWSLHQWAFQRAQEILKPSWIERDVLGVWN